MVDYSEVLPPVPGAVRLQAPGAAAAAVSRDRSYWFDLAFGRTLPACAFSVFLVYKLMLVAQAATAIWHGIPTLGVAAAAINQALGLVYFTMLVVLYVIRLPRRAGERSIPRIAVSFFGSFAIIGVGFLPGVPVRTGMILVADLLAVAGIGYSLWCLAYLGRSFSILPEARRLVTGGPYSLSRHPLYFGEGVAGIGVTLPSLGPPGALLIGLFLGAQYLRMRWEEQILAGEFPEYGEYASRVPRYLPDPRRLLNR